MDLTLDSNNQDELPRIDTKTLADYITLNVAGLVSEPNQSLIRESLNNDLLETFTNDAQSTMLVVNQFSDPADKSVHYTVSNAIHASKDQTLSVVFAKKKLLPIADSPLHLQLCVGLLHEGDKLIIAAVKKRLAPAVQRHEEEARIEAIKLTFDFEERKGNLVLDFWNSDFKPRMTVAKYDSFTPNPIADRDSNLDNSNSLPKDARIMINTIHGMYLKCKPNGFANIRELIQVWDDRLLRECLTSQS